MRRWPAALVAVAAACGTMAATAAAAVRLPVYRDPPGYKGIRKAPPLAPAEQPPLPPAIQLSASGNGPHVLVDEAGTAHIVWNDGRGDQDDAATYCRLKRGATACDATATLTWDKSYGTGDGPQFNTDYDGPRIVQAGEQLVVLSKRYPTVADRPDGSAGSSNTVAWTSSDGGTSWSPAQQVGTLNLGQLAVIAGESNSTIIDSGDDPFCRADGLAGWCLEIYRAGQFGVQTNLSTRKDDNYYPGIGLDELGRPVAIVENLDGTTEVRRWNGVEPITDAANWIPSNIGVADQPAMAGGPAGAFLMAKGAYNSGPFAVRRLNVGGDGVVSAGPPEAITGDRTQFASLFEDGSGALHAAWQDNASDAAGVYERSQTGGAFGATQKLIDGGSNGQLDLGSASDGGGFAVLNHTGGVVGTGQIFAVGYGNQAASGKPGLGGLPGGEGPVTNVTCQKINFGQFDVRTAAGCFFHGQGQYAGVVVSEGELTIDGLRIVPDPGAKIIIDPRKLRLDTVGTVHVLVNNADTRFELFHGEIHRDLSRVVPGTDLFEFPSQAFKANLLGFDVAADIPVRLEKDGVHIPVDLALPPALGGFTGHAELIADASGLKLDSLHIHIGPVPLGVLNVNSLDIDYVGKGDLWSGTGSVTVPAGGTLEAHAEFAMGDFVKATISFTPASPIPIGPFVYLLEIHGGFSVKPIQIQAGARIGAGAAVNGVAPIVVNGTFIMTFPASGPASFELKGDASIFFFDVATMALEFQTDGYAQFRGHVGASLGPLNVDANAEGYIDAPSGKFGADLDGKVELCITVIEEVCGSVGADVAVSNVGFAACGKIAGKAIGLEYPWADFDPIAFINPFVLTESLIEHFEADCDTTGYKSPPPRPLSARVAAAGGQTVAIGRGLPSATIVAKGGGAPPQVTVTGPGGATFASGKPSAAGSVIYARRLNAAYILLNHPKAGDWSVLPNAGSPDITGLLEGDGFKPATLKAKLRGHTIRYRVRNGGHGQSVQFVERGRFGGHVLGSTAKSRGTLRFKPATGAGGKRTVFALVLHDGVATHGTRVGTYVAPAPARPGAVGRLRASKRKHTLTVSWKRAGGAARYVVRLKGSKGTHLAQVLGPKARSVRFTAIRYDEKFAVTVRAVAKSGRIGPIRTARAR